jgi:hypothetical protein
MGSRVQGPLVRGSGEIVKENFEDEDCRELRDPEVGGGAEDS